VVGKKNKYTSTTNLKYVVKNTLEAYNINILLVLKNTL